MNAIGIRPINNIVDITNYVLHETGQPLHAFNADKIKGNKVVVRKTIHNTSFVTLDDIERKLDANDLMRNLSGSDRAINLELGAPAVNAVAGSAWVLVRIARIG